MFFFNSAATWKEKNFDVWILLIIIYCDCLVYDRTVPGPNLFCNKLKGGSCAHKKFCSDSYTGIMFYWLIMRCWPRNLIFSTLFTVTIYGPLLKMFKFCTFWNPSRPVKIQTVSVIAYHKFQVEKKMWEES